jgi:glucose-6-phosphate isomerase
MKYTPGENDMPATLSFDFTNMTDATIGERGVSDTRVAALADRAREINRDLVERRAVGELPFYDLHRADTTAIKEYAAKARTRFTNFVNVGIGGSALGTQALFNALAPSSRNNLPDTAHDGMKLHIADNIDPDFLAGIFAASPPQDTLYNIITKSGSTAETMGTFLLAREALERVVGESWRDHVVVTTDEAKGDLRRIADTEGLASFVVPDGVGGRFSALTPVGLLPAACAGIDIDDLLAGAAAMDVRCSSADVMENPAYLFALYQYLHDVDGGRHISVMMPYSSGLSSLADWFRQLWAESLGKKHGIDGSVVHSGPTPVKALGATDQHSQVQLYAEGPDDKVFTFLAVENFTHDLPMDAAYPDATSITYLGGRTMAELIDAERRGTVYALTSEGRPNMTVTFTEVSAHTVGQFMHALEIATVFSGGLYGIDPLDQPGVEAGKVAAFALMGRPGYEDRADEIRNGLKSIKRYVF